MPVQSQFTSAADGTSIATYRWGDEIAEPVGVVQISHGVAEYGRRYDRLATALVTGYRVYANDHRGHDNSAPSPDDYGDFGAAGFPGVAADMATFGVAIGAENPGLPVFLIAHSMGSFAAQDEILDHSHLYAGVVLSGTTALDVLAAGMAAGDGPAGLEAFNVGFEQRTGFEWLSRDEAEVDKYVADPRCGFELPDVLVGSMFAEGARLADPEQLRRIRADLPLLLVSGQDDPLAGNGELIQLAAQRYRDAGVADVTAIVYPGARHEIFNETNRDAITADVIGWLDARVSRA